MLEQQDPILSLVGTEMGVGVSKFVRCHRARPLEQPRGTKDIDSPMGKAFPQEEISLVQAAKTLPLMRKCASSTSCFYIDKKSQRAVRTGLPQESVQVVLYRTLLESTTDRCDALYTCPVSMSQEEHLMAISQN